MSEPSTVQLLNTASVPPILSVLPELILISPETSNVCAGELLPIPTLPLEFIVNTFILFICFFLTFLKIYPDKIDIDINEYVINFVIQFTCGLFMLGLSNVSIGIGIFSILN